MKVHIDKAATSALGFYAVARPSDAETFAMVGGVVAIVVLLIIRDIWIAKITVGRRA